MPNLRINVPERFTKELKIHTDVSSSDRRLRISSNLLPLMAFTPATRYERRVLEPAGTGFELRTAALGAKQVYERQYTHRRNNPLEVVVEDNNQTFLNAALPSGIERVHLTLRHGVIIGRPVPERTFHIRRAIRDPKTPLEAMVALSSGIDAWHFGPNGAGFNLQALLEYRPVERRDGARDVTESGALTAMANNAFRIVLNEDIYRIDFGRLAEQLAGQPRLGCLIASPQCDEFSPLKGKGLRESAIASVDTTYDMGYELLRLIEVANPASILIENVPAFGASAIGQLILLKLRRWGYHVTADIYDARDFGGLTSRRRWLAVASVFPGFEAPMGNEVPAAGRIWPLIADQIPLCRDVTDTSAMQGGLATGRARLITIDSASAPTITKSEAHAAKDAIRILTPDGRYLAPNETILRRLQGIPEDFSFDLVSQEIATEQIGQSVDGPMHLAFAKAIRRHLAINRGEAVPDEAPLRGVRTAAAAILEPQASCEQLPLFA